MTKIKCVDCGPNYTNHFLARLGARANRFRLRKNPLLEGTREIFRRHFEPHTDTIALWLVRINVLIGFGIFLEKPDERTNGRGAFLWEKAPSKGVKMREFRFLKRPVDTYLAEFNEQAILFEGLPRPQGPASAELDWMDSKSMLRKNFIPQGVPMARGGEARKWSEAVKIFTEIGAPVITKPHVGSRSRHTTIHIKTLAELERGFDCARKLSPWVIIEEELQGLQFRGTVIGGKTIAVLRRDPALVVGDGKLTVRELVEKENQNPKRRGPIYHEIPMGKAAEIELKNQGLNWQSVPDAGRFVALGTKASRGQGGGTVDVTDQTHPDNKALFEKVAGILNDPLIGVDFIIRDISKSWREQTACGVIECNSLPFIDLHKDPLVGTTRDTASPIWDVVFPKQKS